MASDVVLHVPPALHTDPPRIRLSEPLAKKGFPSGKCGRATPWQERPLAAWPAPHRRCSVLMRCCCSVRRPVALSVPHALGSDSARR